MDAMVNEHVHYELSGQNIKKLRRNASCTDGNFFAAAGFLSALLRLNVTHRLSQVRIATITLLKWDFSTEPLA